MNEVYSAGEVTRVNIAIFAKDDYAFGCGVELCRREQMANGRFKDIVYHIMSLYLPKSEFPSKRRLLHYLISEALGKVPETDKLVIFHSELPHMDIYRELKRKASVFSYGKELRFNRVKQIKRDSILLAIGAISRRNSITERLM